MSSTNPASSSTKDLEQSLLRALDEPTQDCNSCKRQNQNRAWKIVMLAAIIYAKQQERP
jgi:hypothetical protein